MYGFQSLTGVENGETRSDWKKRSEWRSVHSIAEHNKMLVDFVCSPTNYRQYLLQVTAVYLREILELCRHDAGAAAGQRAQQTFTPKQVNTSTAVLGGAKEAWHPPSPTHG